MRHSVPELNVVHEMGVMEFFGSLPDGCIQVVVTSPPYWGLRVYGTPATVWGGDAGCEHEWGQGEVCGTGRTDCPQRWETGKRGEVTARSVYTVDAGVTSQRSDRKHQQGHVKSGCATCVRCGAWRGHYGLEPTIDLYVAHTVMWMRALRPKLRDDGTVWLNLGDSYASGKGTCYNPGGGETSLGQARKGADAHPLDRGNTSALEGMGLKQKDLVMMPARVALALQADGWWLRSDIVWAKPNPMPESVTDRPTKAHEYVFLLTKSKNYFYDADAVREASLPQSVERAKHAYPETNKGRPRGSQRDDGGLMKPSGFTDYHLNPAGRNLRSVWRFPTQPYSGAHFATFPDALPRTCILAGSSPQACPECGGPWERVVERTGGLIGQGWHNHGNDGGVGQSQTFRADGGSAAYRRGTLGFRPTCSCDGNDGSGRCIVCDPFAGTATTGVVAIKEGRDFLGCDLMGGDKDFEKGPGGVEHHTANERLAAAAKGLTLREYQEGQGTLL